MGRMDRIIGGQLWRRCARTRILYTLSILPILSILSKDSLRAYQITGPRHEGGEGDAAVDLLGRSGSDALSMRASHADAQSYYAASKEILPHYCAILLFARRTRSFSSRQELAPLRAMGSHTTAARTGLTQSAPKAF